MPQSDSESEDTSLVQGYVRYPRKLTQEAAEAAAWEGIGLSDFYRSALQARIRETDVKKADHARRLKGEKTGRE